MGGQGIKNFHLLKFLPSLLSVKASRSDIGDYFMVSPFIHLSVCQHWHQKQVFWSISLALVAQLDAHATGDQEVAGLTPAGSAIFFCGDLIMKYFLRSFSGSAGSRSAVVSLWRKNVHITDEPLGGLSLSSKSVVR